MIRYLFLVMTCVVVATISPPSFADIKDAFHFMKDDNEFSAEEMDEEALYIRKICAGDVLKYSFYNCDCIAGAYRIEREERGPYVPQSIIYNELFDNPDGKCADKERIAGETYEFCMRYSRAHRSREKNNPEYCTCVANKVATRFSDKPRFSLDYINNIRVRSMLSCD